MITKNVNSLLNNYLPFPVMISLLVRFRFDRDLFQSKINNFTFGKHGGKLVCNRLQDLKVPCSKLDKDSKF